MREDSRNEKSGICWEEGCAAEVMQAGLLRWELQSCSQVVGGFLSATGFPHLSFNNKTQKNRLCWTSVHDVYFFSSNRNQAFLGQLNQLLLSNNGTALPSLNKHR